MYAALNSALINHFGVGEGVKGNNFGADTIINVKALKESPPLFYASRINSAELRKKCDVIWTIRLEY
jgi:hypothetical protein